MLTFFVVIFGLTWSGRQYDNENFLRSLRITNEDQIKHGLKRSVQFDTFLFDCLVFQLKGYRRLFLL